MLKPTALFTFLLYLTLLSSCKKDELQFLNVSKIDTHTNTDRLNKIFWANDTLGFIVGGQRFYRSLLLTTHDAGKTWVSDTFPEANKELFDITASPNGNLYMVGFDGKFLYSNDFGSTWTFRQLYYFTVTGVAAVNDNSIMAVGGVSFSSGLKFYLDGQGDLLRYDSLTYQLNKIKMIDDQTGYCSGYGLMLKTTDGAQTWTQLKIKDDNFNGMSILGNDIWVCGYNGGIYHSGNAGDSWQQLRDGNDATKPHYRLLDIAFKDNQNGWAVGENGLVIHTDDGGHHWMQYNSFTSNALRSISIRPDGTILVSGDNGDLFRLYP